MAPDLHGSRRAQEGVFPQNGDKRGTPPCTPPSVKTVTFKKCTPFCQRLTEGGTPLRAF